MKFSISSNWLNIKRVDLLNLSCDIKLNRKNDVKMSHFLDKNGMKPLYFKAFAARNNLFFKLL